MNWRRMESPFSRVRRIFFRGRNCRKIPETPQKERFLHNLRLRNLKIQSLKKCNSIRPAIPYAQPFHTPTRLPPKKQQSRCSPQQSLHQRAMDCSWSFVRTQNSVLTIRTQRALRSDRKKFAIPQSFYLRCPPGVTEKGSIENANPRSVAQNFQSRRIKLFQSRALLELLGLHLTNESPFYFSGIN